VSSCHHVMPYIALRANTMNSNFKLYKIVRKGFFEPTSGVRTAAILVSVSLSLYFP
jgi:hypothetical protein